MRPTRVVLADDHAVVRAGYRRLLELKPEIAIVAEFEDSESLCAWFAGHEADVLVLDLSMPGRGGLETLQYLRARAPALRILVFTMHDAAAMVSQALQAGADGYITKSSPPGALIDGVEQVSAGRAYFSADVRDILREARPRSRAPHEELSPRAFEIFRLLASGLSVEAIAERLHLSPKTVANYQTAIRQKLELNSTLDMHLYATRHGL